MDISIINEPLILNIHGLSGTALNNNYSGTAFRLMGKMWQTVKDNNLKNKGLNIWVYDRNENVFTGVELLEPFPAETKLEQRNIRLSKYASYTHIGPYHLIKQSGQRIRDELNAKGYQIVLPYIEIYGHWTDDESALETELIMSLA